MNREDFIQAWKEVASSLYDQIISGEVTSISWREVQEHYCFYERQKALGSEPDISFPEYEDDVERKYYEALDYECGEPEPPKRFTIMTREFGEITVDEDTYYKYYAELKNL